MILFNNYVVFRVYELFRELKTSWKQYNFNIYVSPYPKYWFMFINPIVTIDEWIELFERNYPLVSQRPIMNVVREIIKELH